MSQQEVSATGVGYAVAAYGLWGVVPVYWKLVAAVPAAELLAPRIVWTALFMLLVLAVTRRRHELRFEGLGQLLTAGGAALLLAVNWGVFIYAVQTDRVLATSLGYYINPLVSVLLGLVVLGERLNLTQACAVAIAAAGVVYLTFETGSLPWISVVLACTFGLYGLVHKLAPRPPLAGLTTEMLLLAPLAVLVWGWLALRGEAALLRAPPTLQLAVAASALVTAAPMLCFHAATRRLPLIAVGMFQYIAPTLTLALAVAHYDEPFSASHGIAFGCVWTGLAIFTADSLIRGRAQAAEPA